MIPALITLLIVGGLFAAFFVVERFLRGLDGVHASSLAGDPGDVIVNLAEKQRVSHLVMGSAGRNAPGLFMGGLAEDVLSRVDCSVLTLKPAGFETPIDVNLGGDLLRGKSA